MAKPLLSFFFKLSSTSTIFLIGLFSFATILFVLPGQNDLQTLILNPQTTKVKATTINLDQPSAYPVAKPDIKIPYLSAKAAIVIDSQSGAILMTKNPDSPLLPASTTKIMTAAVAFDEYDLNDIVTINNENQSIGHTAELFHGEKLTIEQLLYAMLVSSGNDAALALGQFHPQGYSHFIDLMSQKTKSLNLNNTQFQNVSGVEQYNHYTSVRDLALLTKEMMTNPIFVKIVATKNITITSQTGQTHRLTNINELLGVVPGIKGVKTGWTQLAGECLVTATERDNHEIITVVLGSQDRFGESKLLIDWAYANHFWKTPQTNSL